MAESEIAEGSAERGSWQALDNCECCEASCYTRCIAFVYKCGEWSHHLAGIIASTCEFVNYVRRPCGMESFTLNMFLTMIYFFPCCNLPRGPRFFFAELWYTRVFLLLRHPFWQTIRTSPRLFKVVNVDILVKWRSDVWLVRRCFIIKVLIKLVKNSTWLNLHSYQL